MRVRRREKGRERRSADVVSKVFRWSVKRKDVDDVTAGNRTNATDARYVSERERNLHFRPQTTSNS